MEALTFTGHHFYTNIKRHTNLLYVRVQNNVNVQLQFCSRNTIHLPVTQWTEYCASNAAVVGSNPTGEAKLSQSERFDSVERKLYRSSSPVVQQEVGYRTGSYSA